MANRVYWIGLEFLLRPVPKYVGRYAAQLQANLTDDQWTCVQAVVNAITSCLALLPSNNPTP